MFRFYLCENEEMVKTEVASRRAECGYVIYEGFREKLDAGSFRRTIGVYSAPSTVTAALSTETVFAALTEIYDREILKDFAEEAGVFEPLGLPGSRERRELAAEAGAYMTAGLQTAAPSGLNIPIWGRRFQRKRPIRSPRYSL